MPALNVSLEKEGMPETFEFTVWVMSNSKLVFLRIIKESIISPLQYVIVWWMVTGWRNWTQAEKGQLMDHNLQEDPDLGTRRQGS